MGIMRQKGKDEHIYFFFCLIYILYKHHSHVEK